MFDDKYLYSFGYLINYSILLVVSNSLACEYSKWFVVITSIIIWLMLIMLFNIRKYSIIAMKLIAILYVVAFFGKYNKFNFYKIINLQFENFFELLKGDLIVKFFNNVYLFYTNQLLVIPEGFDTKIFIIVSMIISCLVMILILKKCFKVLLILPPLFFLVQWTRYVDISFVAIRWYMVGFLGYLVYIFSNFKNKKTTNQYNRFSVNEYFIYSLIIAVIIVILTNVVYFIYPLKIINNHISNFMPTFTSMRTGYSSRSDKYAFSFDSTMYQPNGKLLGGRISKRNYDIVMFVSSNKGSEYFRGRVKDFYTGYGWNSTQIKFTNKNEWELKDLPYHETRVYLSNIQTATVFTTLGVRYINLNEDKVFMNTDKIIYYKRSSFERRLKYYDFEAYDVPINIMLTNELNQYLQLPENISERLIELSYEITHNSVNASDSIEDIRKYLTNNFDYSLFVSNVPRGSEFVDYFIFEEGKGYCTYFATAMAIIARINGIPSRYIEGYISDLSKNDQGFYEITADRAHAWTEIYIDDRWQLIEATPYYIDEKDKNGEIEIDREHTQSEIVDTKPKRDYVEYEPMIIEKDTIKFANIFCVICLSLVCITVLFVGIRLCLAKRLKKLNIKQRLMVILKIVDYDEKFAHSIFIPEEYIKNYVIEVFNIVISDKTINIVQKIIYSSLSLDNYEKRYIIKEIESIEKLLRKKHGGLKVDRVLISLILKNYRIKGEEHVNKL